MWEKDGSYFIRYKLYKLSYETNLQPNEVLPSISICNKQLDSDDSVVLVHDNIATLEDGLKLLAGNKSSIASVLKSDNIVITEFALQAEIYHKNDSAYPQYYYIVAMSDLTVNPSGHGGYRVGAGRKKTHLEGSKPHTFYCSDGEVALIKALLQLLRENKEVRYSIYNLLVNNGQEKAVNWLMENDKFKTTKNVKKSDRTRKVQRSEPAIYDVKEPINGHPSKINSSIIPFSPKLASIMLELGWALLKRGVNKFKQWVVVVKQHVGDHAVPYLKPVWEFFKYYPEDAEFNHEIATAMLDVVGGMRAENSSLQEICDLIRNRYGE